MSITIEIPFGKGKQVLHAPEERLKGIIEKNSSDDTLLNETDIVRNALEHPVGTCRLREIVKGKKSVTVISSDHTRPVPSRITMPLLLEEIRSGNPQADITILIATGLHRPTTEQELRDKYGDEIVDNEKIVIHKAREKESMAFFGYLPSGGELWLNALINKTDLVISEGFIEPHFFAGFSGGRKSILPGIASAETIMYNHNAGFIASPYARQGKLDQNPIHRDMLYAAEKAGLSFILNVVINSEKKITAAFAGDREEAHRAGCRYCDETSRVNPVVSDIAVTSNGGYPLDQNVYQSVKGMTAAESCVREGGAIIMNAALSDGAGGEDFYRWFADRKCAEDVKREIENIPPDKTHFDQWEAQILARIMTKAVCWMVTGEENRSLVESMHFKWAPDADTALSEASQMLGTASTITVIPDGVGVIM